MIKKQCPECKSDDTIEVCVEKKLLKNKGEGLSDIAIFQVYSCNECCHEFVDPDDVDFQPVGGYWKRGF